MSEISSNVRNKPVELFCAVDIEALGHANGSIPISVGFCYGTSWEDRIKVRISIMPDQYHVYHTKYGQKWNPPSNGLNITDFIQDICEPMTWSEFWSKNTKILETIFKEAVPTNDGFQALSNFIKKLYSIELLSAGTSRPYKVTFIGDNPGYDFSHINAALEKYCDELPLRYSNRRTFTELRELYNQNVQLPSDGYHGIKDPSERIKYFSSTQLVDHIVKKNSNHSHLPDDDAEGIYMQYLLMKDAKFLDEMKSKLDNNELMHIEMGNLKFSN